MSVISHGLRTGRDRVRNEAKLLVHWMTAHGVARYAMRASAKRGDPQGRLFTMAGANDPASVWPAIEQIRAGGPVHRSGIGYATASHAAVKQVLTSGDFATGIPGRTQGPLAWLIKATSSGNIHPVEPPSLLVSEPPEHTRYRKLVTSVFTARSVARLRERTEQIAGELLDRLDGQDRAQSVDIVQTYCGLLPVTVIAEILGVPASERDNVLTMGAAAAASLDIGLPWRQFRSVDSALAAFDAWLTDHLAELRRHPGDDLFSELTATRDEDGGLTDKELKATAGLVLAAGFETTVNLLGNGIVLLCEHPDQLERLRADTGLWPNAVEEILRADPPVLLTGRVCTGEAELAGQPMSKGDAVTVLLAGANRDPAVFTDPALFDVGRENAREHLSFSAGRHHCLGASLARMEGEVGLRTLFDRYPHLRLMPGARRRNTHILRGYDTLPVRLGGGPA